MSQLEDFDNDQLAAIIRAKQEKFGRENDGAVWLPVDITKANAFQILAGLIATVRQLGGEVTLRNGLTINWNNYQETMRHPDGAA
jgi:hypothetical protein